MPLDELIKISEDTKKILIELKINSKETFDETIRRLILKNNKIKKDGK